MRFHSALATREHKKCCILDGKHSAGQWASWNYSSSKKFLKLYIHFQNLARLNQDFRFLFHEKV